MKKIEFLQELKNRGSITNAEEAQAAIDTWRKAGRGFDDDEPAKEQPKEQQGVIGKVADFASKTASGAVQHPIQTARGLGLGAAKSLAGMATDAAANVNPEENEDINMTMPGRFPVRSVAPESSKQIIKRREWLEAQGVTPITEGLTQQESRAAKVGEVLAPASLGELAMGKPVGALVGKGIKAVGKILPKAAEKVEKITPKIVKDEINVLRNEQGSIDWSKSAIPDIDEAEKIVPGKSTNPILTKKQVKQNIEKAPKVPLGSGIDSREAAVLSVPKSETSAPFTDYAIQAQNAAKGVDKFGNAVETPYDLVGKRGVQAHAEMEKLTKEIGAKKAEYLSKIDDAVVSNGDFIRPDGIKQQFSKDLKDVLGVYIDENNVIKAAASGAKNRSLVPDARKIANMIDELPNEMTAEQLDSFSSNLNGLLTKRTQGQLKPKADQIDLIVGRIKDKINNELEEKAKKLLDVNDFDNYLAARKNYGNMVKLTKELSGALGREVAEGTTSRGASIMKRAVQSTPDAGSKVLFKTVKDLTGIDLIQEAHYADIAMKAVGDYRAGNLLENTGKTEKTLRELANPTVAGIAIKAGSKALDKARGSKINRLIDYYNKMQRVTK